MTIKPLSDLILGSLQHEDVDDGVQIVFAKKDKGRFISSSDAMILKLTEEEAEQKNVDISNSKCPGFEYFLELFILKEFFDDLQRLKEYESKDDLVKRVIYYAEFDA